MATPMLLLKGIDIKSILDNYLSSKYSQEEIGEKKKVNIKSLDMTQDTVLGNTNINGIYERKDGNMLVRVYTTNSRLFEAYLDKKINQVKVPCVYCRRPIAEDFSLSVITAVNRPEPDLTVYYGYDAVCAIKDGGLQCAYTHLRNESKKDPQNNIYLDAMTYLKNLSYYTTETSEIQVLPDWRLLISNGGCMDDKTFFSIKDLVYNPNIVFIPGKIQWNKKL